MLRKTHRAAGGAIVALMMFLVSVCILVKERVFTKALGDFLILLGFLMILVIYGLRFRYVPDDKGGQNEKGKT